MTSFK